MVMLPSTHGEHINFWTSPESAPGIVITTTQIMVTVRMVMGMAVMMRVMAMMAVVAAITGASGGVLGDMVKAHSRVNTPKGLPTGRKGSSVGNLKQATLRPL